ncbi:MAG: CoA transferase subunit A [Motiliproteus sp.]
MKTAISHTEAIENIPHGSSLMIGGFMGVGTPEKLIDELIRQKKRISSLIANDSAKPGVGIGKLIDARLVERLIVSHIGTNPETQRQLIAEELLVELVPQGTLAERVRCGGFGLGGVLTTTAIGTDAAEGKRWIDIEGEKYLLELPLTADIALIKAHQCDYYGNLRYRLTAQNFNPLMATAATTVFAEAEELVPVGCISPDSVHTPGTLVDHIITGWDGA